MMKAFVLGSAMLMGPQLAAQDADGALPRGKGAGAPPASAAAAKAPGEAAANPTDCSLYLSNPSTGTMLQSGSMLYFVGPKPAKSRGAGGTHILYQVDLDAQKSKRILALNAGSEPALVAHGRAIEAVSIMDFPNPGCGEGSTSGLGAKWVGEQRISRSYPQSTYKLLPTSNGRELADMVKNTIQSLDIGTMQRRTIVSFAPKQIPLYLQQAPTSLVVYNSQEHQLERYNNLEKKPDSVLKLKKEMKLLQQGEKFGIISAKNAGKTVQISQVKDWSGDDFRSFELILPAPWTEAQASFAVDFPSGKVLAYGANAALRKQLKQILLFDGPSKKLLKALQPPSGFYFGAAMLSPDDARVFALLMSLKDSSAEELWVIDGSDTKVIDLVKSADSTPAASPVPLK